MKADEKRQAVARKYDELIGRNHYSQPLRDYCYRKHRDGNYYSDCSSSICYAYKEAGYGFGILNTAGIYQSAWLVTVDVPIRDGQVPVPHLVRGISSSSSSSQYLNTWASTSTFLDASDIR